MKKTSEKIKQQLPKFSILIQNLFNSELRKNHLTSAQLDVLMTIWFENSLILTDIAKKTSKDGPTITGIMDRLENEKLIKRERTRKDRRVIKAVVTPKGLKLKENLMKAIEELLIKTFNDTDDNDVDIFEKFLDTVLSVSENKLAGSNLI